MEALEGLHPVKFNYKRNKGDEYVGFIAEDVPELVATKERKSMVAMDVVAVLTKVVQEQQKTLKEQQKRSEVLTKLVEKQQVSLQEQHKTIEELRKEINELKKRK